MSEFETLDGRVRLYKRERSKFWQCSTILNGKKFRESTGEVDFSPARERAEEWYFNLRGLSQAGLINSEKTFRDAAKQFEIEYEVITVGQRSPRWVEGHKIRIRLHLNPFFGDLGLSEITPGKVQEYRMHRATTPPQEQLRLDKKAFGGEDSPLYKPPARSTIHDELVTLRQVLKTAVRHNWLASVPDLSPPYKTQGKVVHRPWFSPEEYKQLYKASGEYAKSCAKHHRWDAEQTHDYILFMANTGLRPDEAKNLQHQDVSIIKDEDTSETILLIEVRGKRGFGYCKSMPGAVQPYRRLLNRSRRQSPGEDSSGEISLARPSPTDPVFPGEHKRLFNGILERAGLKLDRDGQKRTAYSLRHYYISARLLAGADIYQIAKNCRTSVEIIEKFYAAHIRNSIDASAVNTKKAKRTFRKRGAPSRRPTAGPNGPKARPPRG